LINNNVSGTITPNLARNRVGVLQIHSLSDANQLIYTLGFTFSAFF